MNFYINGNQVNKQAAKQFLDMAAMNSGYDEESYSAAWNRAGRSEEAREFINEISDYQLEIIAA